MSTNNKKSAAASGGLFTLPSFPPQSNFDAFKLLIFYPFIMRALYWILRKTLDPMYMNPICLMDFVRFSELHLPEEDRHYIKQPIWKEYLKNSNITCLDMVNEQAKVSGFPEFATIYDYFKHVYHFGETEFYLMYGIAFLYAGISLWWFLKDMFTGKVFTKGIWSIVGLFTCVFVSWNHGSLFHLLSHYQNDLTHLNGNVMHHSAFTVNNDNAALVNTLPPGLIVNFPYNYIVTFILMYRVLDYWKVDKWIYLNLAAPLILAKFVMQMKLIHPYIHQTHRSWYGDKVWSGIPIYLLNEYDGHVLCHHVNGACLGDSPVYTWFYDFIMTKFHAPLYRNNVIEFGSSKHEVFTLLFDYFLVISIAGFLWITVGIFSPFLQKEESKIKSD